MQKKSIGARLKECRGNTPVSKVAKDNGISESALRMYECDNRIPRDSIKIRLAYYFKTSVEDLFF